MYSPQPCAHEVMADTSVTGLIVMTRTEGGSRGILQFFCFVSSVVGRAVIFLSNVTCRRRASLQLADVRLIMLDLRRGELGNVAMLTLPLNMIMIDVHRGRLAKQQGSSQNAPPATGGLGREAAAGCNLFQKIYIQCSSRNSCPKVTQCAYVQIHIHVCAYVHTYIHGSCSHAPPAQVVQHPSGFDIDDV